MGHPLVMGRRTYESIGRPLPRRTTVVVTRDPGWAADGVVVRHSVDDALAAAGALDETVFVVGGASVYAATLPRADRLVVTWVEQEPAGDTVFPDVDWARWRETARETHDGFSIVTYGGPAGVALGPRSRAVAAVAGAVAPAISGPATAATPARHGTPRVTRPRGQ